ncbi:hypothetical protein LOTGIDRAFT_179104 [Lottia gigantea]|uniref:Anaphase-promoting complex subunit 10 n=1 Tax=Lottia gigantea TaxID=225164 RepID=V4BIQ0_LOTGI|nr:hypothetical protein LOTGIDRAFT_179104 [Lottia gigantea]ESO88499.1 hypothetical protein LOTGIDRAFT_179104 [Lottia gigantea]
MSIKVSGTQNNNIFKDEKEGKLREVGNQAAWSLSSCKPGFGVEQLRDDAYDTYWQSDGPQPHLANIQFRRKTTIYDICFFANYKADESYTPNKISIRVGSHFNDLIEVELLEMTEPVGWISVPLKDSNDKPIRTFMIQVAILSNHQNGRDTHVRRIKVRSPTHTTDLSTSRVQTYSSPELQMYSVLR